MANTVIQIKRSTVTSTPPNGSLDDGELAYSYNSDRLFIGNSSGTGVVEIGGKYYNDLTVAAYNAANGAPGIANTYAVAVGAASNAWANSIITGSGNFANSTFVKLVEPNQTITGNLSITGKLTVAGNAYVLDTETLKIDDPLIYLGGNNYVSDTVDIGFVANYNNGSSNLHTGFFRDHVTKEYYLFEGYTEEPDPNHIDLTGNNFTISILNSTLRSSNIILNGKNVESLLLSISNKANSTVQAGFTTIVANGTSIVADSNNDTLTITTANGIAIVGNATTDTIDFSLIPTGVTAATYGGADRVGRFTVDQFGRITSAANVTIAIDASAITSGTLGVARGGTGATTFTSNGVVFGNGTGALQVTAAGTEGQVLQASAAGVPQFGMLDGGNF